MDFTQFMAAFALAAFWLNTLLIAGAGWSECAGLRRRYAYMTEGTGARRGAVTGADGPEGALAEFTVTQVGRSNGRGPIVFHDRGHAARLLGGRVTLADGEAMALPAEAAVEVWISRRALQRAAAPRSGDAGHAEVLAAATRAAGWERRVATGLRVGDTIWLAGQVGAGLVLADADPRRWLARITGLTVLLVLGVFLAAGACTAACLWPPGFGLVSKLGAFAALVAFNLFQLLGKLHHDAIQPPSLRVLGGQWAGSGGRAAPGDGGEAG